MTPVCQRRSNQAVDVAEDVLHRFAVFGWCGWELRLQIARFHVGKNRKLIDVFEIIGNPIDQLMAETTKLRLLHITQLGREVGLGAIHGAHLSGLKPRPPSKLVTKSL